MTYKNFYISHKNYKWESNDRLQFVNNSNYKKFLKSDSDIDARSSLEDLNLKEYELAEFISSVDKIILLDLDLDFVEKVETSSLHLYVIFFNFLKNSKTCVENFEWFDKFKDFVYNNNHGFGPRPDVEKVVWITGCSITNGTGVTIQQRYPSLIQKNTDLPVLVSTRPGSSIAWQADQLLCADIKPGDIVIWGLTTFVRVDYADGIAWKCTGPEGYLTLPEEKKYWNIDFFGSFSQTLVAIKQIMQVENFCKKIGAKLYLVNLLDAWGNCVFGQNTNFLDLSKLVNNHGRRDYIDVGTDNQHPGPKQHQEYADKIFNFIKELNHGKTI